MRQTSLTLVQLGTCVLLTACSSTAPDNNGPDIAIQTATGGIISTTGGTAFVASTGGVQTDPMGGTLDTGGILPVASTGGIVAETGGGTSIETTGGTSATGGMIAQAGPDDGDPNAPIVAAPGVGCGSNPSVFGLTTTNAVIGGRDVHVAYPCNKHEGAPVTFILNLHGTMPDEGLKLYQVAYFAANNFVQSHNLITVAPKSVVSQWGNSDGGADEPHILEVIDWVYETFSGFDIRSMWVGGHSWGAMYTTSFVCKPELADKVDGAILMSTRPTMPACADRISVINTNAENDIAAPLPQGATPASHGCGAAEMSMIGNNEQTLWPDCAPNYVHSNYLMFGKGHSDYMDAEVVESIVDLIKSSRP